MKITRYKDKENKTEHTIVLYTDLHITLEGMCDIINHLDREKVSERNRKLFVPYCQRDDLEKIKEILKMINEEEDTCFGWHYGTFLGLEIFLLGKETEKEDDFLRVMSKREVDHYLFRKVTNEKEEKKVRDTLFILFLGILTTIIIIALIIKL